MACVEPEGSTLGEKHRHYNKLVNDAITTNKPQSDFNASDNDIENLMKIDIACNKKDIDYILNVLKCEDMLYVSRAIKQSTWLITDPQYSHIINVNYLHTQLFPKMISKASAKLMHQIRINLKEEARVEQFYNYYKYKNLKLALKWLPYCSLTLIENEIEKCVDEIDDHLLKRLCERSVTVLEKYIKSNEYYRKQKMKATMFLINTETEKYLDLVEYLPSYNRPLFGPTHTNKLMKKCPQRIKDKFDLYYDKINLETFAKSFKKEDIKEFLIKQTEKKDLKNWFTFNNLKHFVKCMPKDGRFDFLKKYFINKIKKDDQAEMFDESGDIFYCGMMARCGSINATNNSENIYRWYRFAPFETAFGDLTKLIRAESSSMERVAMLGVLLFCAGRNQQHVHTLIQYYHDKHINEPFKFKIQFVNMVITKTNTHKFNETTWNILNKIFHSLEVYTDSENNVQSCVEAIIVYKILHKEPIPEVIEKKFKFNSLKSFQKKFDVNENEMVFTYLYTRLVNKVKHKVIILESDLTEVVELLKDIENLLIDWKRELVDYPWILDKIRELINIKNNNCWKVSLSSLYNQKKSWRKVMFKESLVMCPSAETCYNALKHDPELLVHCSSAVEELRRDEETSLQHLLKTIRLYWPQTLATEWQTSYLAGLDQPGGHKAIVRGICTLLPQKQLLDIVKKYAPTDPKINWSEDDEVVLSLRKQFARSMHLARPQPPPEIVLLYAKGDYLQFALPSLNAVLHNISSHQTREHVTKLLDAPVSLQKHGIRVAFTKLESEELKQVFSNIWKTSKNASIRAVIFKQTYELLCREKKSTMIEEIWKLISLFIENLSAEENKTIYETLGKIDKVPLLVKGRFFMKSFKCLKALPPKANCESIIKDLTYNMKDLMEHLDPDFVEEMLLESLDKKFTTMRYQHLDIMAAYLLCSKSEESQYKRFKKILLPILELSFTLWDVKHEGCFRARQHVIELLQELSKYFQNFVLEKKMVFPSKLFTSILHLLESKLNIQRNYMTLRTWKLIVAYVKVLEEYNPFLTTMTETSEISQSDYYDPKSVSKYNEFYLKAIPKFSELCLQYLKEDVENLFPSVYLLFADALKYTFNNINEIVYLACLSSLLSNDRFIESYLVSLMCVPRYFCSEDDAIKKEVNKIREKIYSHPSTEIQIHYYRKFKNHSLENSCNN